MATMRLNVLRTLIKEILDDGASWEPYLPSQAVIDMWHVTPASNLHDIFSAGLVAGAASMSSDGSPADLVYFFVDPHAARMLADKINDDAPAAVLGFRIPAKMLSKYDPKVDPEEEFSGASIAFWPDQGFVKKAIVVVYTDAPDLVPKQWRPRVKPLGEFR